MASGGRPDDWQPRDAIEQRRRTAINGPKGANERATAGAGEGREHGGVLLVAPAVVHRDGVHFAHALVAVSRLHSEDVIHHPDWLDPAPLDGRTLLTLL